MASAYSPDQVRQFLEYIDLPQHLHDSPPTPQFLELLHVYTIAKLPYENLSLHYDPSHTVDLDPQHLFRKTVVANRGRGGFCMEVAILYNHILRASGFDAYTAGARTRPRVEGVPGGDFPGWAHIVNIVTFPDGTKVHSDVAFGGDGATKPMPLDDGRVHSNLGTQEIRLVRGWMPAQAHRTEVSKVWMYEYRNGPDREWNTFYSFAEVEFLQLDWGVVNYWICNHPDSNQVKNLLVVKFLRRNKEGGSEEGEQEIYGKRMLVHGVVKQNLGGRTEIVQACTTESERVSVLESLFNISLSEEEKAAIYDTPLKLA